MAGDADHSATRLRVGPFARSTFISATRTRAEDPPSILTPGARDVSDHRREKDDGRLRRVASWTFVLIGQGRYHANSLIDTSEENNVRRQTLADVTATTGCASGRERFDGSRPRRACGNSNGGRRGGRRQSGVGWSWGGCVRRV